MKHYQALVKILESILGLPVHFAKDSQATPNAGEVLLIKVKRQMDEQTQMQYFSGYIAALVEDIDLLETTRFLTHQGNFSKTTHRIGNYEILAFENLPLQDNYPRADIQNI